MSFGFLYVSRLRIVHLSVYTYWNRNRDPSPDLLCFVGFAAEDR